jgi:hypothetical protein
MTRLKHLAAAAPLALLLVAYAHAATRATAPGCKTSGLAVWLALGEGGAAAGSTYRPLELTNISHHACSLSGFPGVSAVRGRRLGSPAGRDRTHPPRTVMLTPGHTAHAILRIVNVANYPASRCGPVEAAGLRVYPPNQRAAAEIPFSFRACSCSGPIYLSIRAVEPGVGVPGH